MVHPAVASPLQEVVSLCGEWVFAEGTLAPFDAQPGDVKGVGECAFAAPELDRAVHAAFEAQLEGTDEAGHKVLMTRGVDLLADTPEAAYLLDAMLEYMQSEGFVMP